MLLVRSMAVLAGLALIVLGAPPDPKALARGRQLFQEACGFCHGEDATGARGPDLIRSTVVNHDDNGNLIGPVIRNGKEEKGMPAFPYSAEQISDI
jgi:cytochrome c oxidase cbb3-type subunit 3